jgi:hypothetical protein
VQKRSLGWTRTLTKYPIFNSVRDVPLAAFDNPHLIVERFLPERRGDNVLLRQLHVFGNQWVGRELISSDPILKGFNSRAIILPLHHRPKSLNGAANSVQTSFCKMDYVIHDGKGILLDINPTPTLSFDTGNPELLAATAQLAKGIAQFELPRDAPGAAGLVLEGLQVRDFDHPRRRTAAP